MSSYGFSTHLAQPFADVVARVTAALKAEARARLMRARDAIH